jgi:hypothetical protein
MDKVAGELERLYKTDSFIEILDGVPQSYSLLEFKHQYQQENAIVYDNIQKELLERYFKKEDMKEINGLFVSSEKDLSRS